MVTGALAGSHPSSATDKLPHLSAFICKVGTVTFVLSGFSKEPPDKGNVGVQKLAVGLYSIRRISRPRLSRRPGVLASGSGFSFCGWPVKVTEQDLGSLVSLLETKVSSDSRNTGRWVIVSSGCLK